MSDRRLLYAAAFLRALATGMIAVIVAIDLAERGFVAGEVGLVVGAGLAGAASAALLVTIVGDRVGRRAWLVGIALAGALGGVVVALAGELATIGAAAFVGMLNGMGRDRGASLILDQAMLPDTAADRTAAFARYNICQDAGHALGGLAAAVPGLVAELGGVDQGAALRIGVLAYAAILATTAWLYAQLSNAMQPARPREALAITPTTKAMLIRLSALFGLDGLAGGFVTTALVSLFLFERFGVSATAAGILFFAARIANAGSHLGAAWLARRIGLVNTMVFTHIPSSLLLVTVAFAPDFPTAALLFLLREGLAEMDVPTRQSYVMAVVRPAERTFASGVTHLVRLAAWAIAPAFAGVLMSTASLTTPLVLGAAMKIAYDLLLWLSFRHTHAPDELAAAPVH